MLESQRRKIVRGIETFFSIVLQLNFQQRPAPYIASGMCFTTDGLPLVVVLLSIAASLQVLSLAYQAACVLGIDSRSITAARAYISAKSDQV